MMAHEKAPLACRDSRGPCLWGAVPALSTGKNPTFARLCLASGSHAVFSADCQIRSRVTRTGMPRKSWHPLRPALRSRRGGRGEGPRGPRGNAAKARHPPTSLDRILLYGWHPVTAALENPDRRLRKLLVTENALRRLKESGVGLPIEPQVVPAEAFLVHLPADAVHQGLLAEADPLPAPGIEDLDPEGMVVMLDQVTDPHNVGAILRCAAAFAVMALVTTSRHSPEATGVLAK